MIPREYSLPVIKYQQYPWFYANAVLTSITITTLHISAHIQKSTWAHFGIILITVQSNVTTVENKIFVNSSHNVS